VAEVLKILVVEDDLVDQKIMGRSLRKADLLCDIEFVEDGKSALSLLDKNDYDFCFFDYLLPGMTGLELLDKTRKMGVDLPIVIVTSQTDKELGDKAIRFGATNYITKTLISPEGLSLIIRNSINIRSAEKQLLIAKNQALQNAKVKQDFLANMSHEIRTPMNAILGFCSLLKGAYPKGDYKEEYLDNISVSAENLLVIINDILDFSKIESGKLTIETVSFELKRLMSLLNDTYQHQAEKRGNKLVLTLDEDLPKYIKGDSVRMNQILINLIGNAIKFTSDGDIHFRILKKDNSTILFEVEDQGIGIKNENLEKIFDSFSQAETHTARKFGGTGLGLSIAQDLVKLMKGEIGVVSEVGKGSKFFFEIPLIIGSKPVDEERAYLEAIDITGVKVLVLEDNELNQILIMKVLEDLGCECMLGENGKEGLQLFKNNLFDIVLSDIQMPIMDGYQTSEAIRKIDLKIPIVALTAHAIESERKRCIVAGMNEVVTKPFKPEDIKKVIFNYVKQSKSKVG
jgi:signal transduction histidine kinase